MKNSQYKKTFDSDLYIMIPFQADNMLNLEQLNQNQTDPIVKEYLNSMKENSEYECNNKVVEQIQRVFIGKKDLVCFNYNYDGTVLAKESVYLFLTFHTQTGLYLLTIIDLNNKFSPTQIEDQVTTNQLFVYDDEQCIHIDDYMKQEFTLTRCGDTKMLLSLSNKPKDAMEFQCMIASETYKPFLDSNQYYQLNSNEIKEASCNNFSQYEFYELYAYKSVVIYVLHTFGSDDILNVQDEIPILFIMEMILFQNASVSRTNNKIVSQLTSNDTVSLYFIENLYREFGKTICFWNENVFKYPTVQNIANQINNAFGTKQIIDEYYKNQNHLEHIVNLRDIQISNRESKILNIIVLCLTIVQVIPVVIEFLNWLFHLQIPNIHYFYLLDLIILLVILVLVIIHNKKNKRKRNYK